MSWGRKLTFNWAWAGTVAALVLVAFPAVTLSLLNWSDDRTARWVHELRQRKLHAAQQVAGKPRLLVVGGSSGLFSVDAELLSAKLGRPAINLASHAGLRLRFHLDDVRRIAHRGDVVLLYLEYEQYRGPKEVPVLVRNYLWTYEPLGILRLPWPQMVQQIYGYKGEDYRASWERLRRRWSGVETPEYPAVWQGYTYTELSACGDIRAEPPSRRLRITSPFAADEAIKENEAEELKKFFRWARKHGIQVIAALPATQRVADVESKQVQRTVDPIRKFYRKQKIAILKTPNTRQMPGELFMDTVYHASSAGRRLITEALVKELKPLLKLPMQEGEPITFLVGSPSAPFERETVYAENDSIAYRFISNSYLKHPSCITVAKACELAAAGNRVLFAEPLVGKLFEDAGVATTVLSQRSVTLSDWIRRFPQHVFALATVGTVNGSILPTDLPEPFATFLQNASPSGLAFFGTGEFERVQSQVTGTGVLELRRARSERWPQRGTFPMEVALHADSETQQPVISVERSAVIRGQEPGLAVAVLDPRSGTIVARATFQGRDRLEFELRQVGDVAR